MRHGVIGRIIVVACCAFSFSGCDWYVKGGHNQQQGPWVEGGVSGRMMVQRMASGFTTQAVSYDQVVMALEASGGTQLLDGNGEAVVSLWSDAGTVIASSSFPYVVRSGMATLSSPQSVEAWAAQYPDASEIKVRLNSIPTMDALGGPTASLSATTVYQGDLMASATTSWTPAGSSCSRTICPPVKEQ